MSQLFYVKQPFKSDRILRNLVFCVFIWNNYSQFIDTWAMGDNEFFHLTNLRTLFSTFLMRFFFYSSKWNVKVTFFGAYLNDVVKSNNLWKFRSDRFNDVFSRAAYQSPSNEHSSMEIATIEITKKTSIRIMQYKIVSYRNSLLK